MSRQFREPSVNDMEMLSSGAPIALFEALIADRNPELGRIDPAADALTALADLGSPGDVVTGIGVIVLALFTSALLTCTVRQNPGGPECRPRLVTEPPPGSRTPAMQFQSDCNVVLARAASATPPFVAQRDRGSWGADE